jgi:hypothetical protein
MGWLCNSDEPSIQQSRTSTFHRPSSQGRARNIIQSHILRTCPDNILSIPSRLINRPRRAGTRTIIPPRRRLINNIINNNIDTIQIVRTGPAVTTLTLRNMTTRSTRQNVGTRRIWTRTEVIRTINSTWPRISTTKGRGMASFTVDRVGRRWHNLRLELDQ